MSKKDWSTGYGSPSENTHSPRFVEFRGAKAEVKKVN